MVRNTRGKLTELILGKGPAKGVSDDLRRAALRKILMIEQAECLDDLRSPPGNRLETLKGDRLGQYSIRINDQWRICFEWRDGDAWQVEVTDYH